MDGTEATPNLCSVHETKHQTTEEHMNWLMKLLFPSLNQRVRINPDHLPGLKPPTISPIRPTRKPPERDAGPDLDGMYRRYKASPASKTKRKGKHKGFDL